MKTKHYTKHHRRNLEALLLLWDMTPKWVFYCFKFKDIPTSLMQFFILYFFVTTTEKFQALKDSNDLYLNQTCTLSTQHADLHEISESFSASVSCGCHCPSGPSLPLCTNSPKQFSWSLSTWSVVNIWIVLLSNSVKNLVFH